MTHICAPGCTCLGTSAPDPSFVPDEQEKDGPTWFQILAIYAAAFTAQFLFIAWLETF